MTLTNKEVSFTYTDSDEGYAISRLPGRKRLALCKITQRGGYWEPIAYFTSVDAANDFLSFLYRLSGHTLETPKEHAND